MTLVEVMARAYHPSFDRLEFDDRAKVIAGIERAIGAAYATGFIIIPADVVPDPDGAWVKFGNAPPGHRHRQSRKPDGARGAP